MAALVFRLRAAPPERLDLSALTRAGLAGLDRAAIAALVIGTTRQAPTVGDLFEVIGDDTGEIVFEGGSDRFDRIGAGLTGAARITVVGDAGLDVGAGMKGGAIRVTGSALHRAGAGMTGGLLTIGGDAGDFTGGTAASGAMAGQAGGVIVVGGRVGDRAGDRMRRGLLVALTGTGAHAGARMSGGTIVTAELGAEPGTLMKRGTMVAGRHGDLGPTFVPAGRYELPFLRLLARHIATTVPVAAGLIPERAMRWRGDMAALGKGEILIGAG
ncbi:formylmethanofuran dehydrogenase subunit C [Prosthecodimorpha staleyi]|uniref:Formylmethanofuran dehydrogenase subunit C n=1 Tax=Prosthecodimorpha staleyi TaxID=2840188 RepID=A0A947GJL2_9HYPH|nr:formylmethanofuran dehydrogenase subunit C [Prosthecodimorpha staleyi]MBT9291889.1 formylmethanofuran dehydrogenase subunit C [Prosthecodimorpha staleyi]